MGRLGKLGTDYQRAMFPEVRPMHRWTYAVVVRIIAWLLRTDRMTAEEIDPAVRKAWPRFPWEWRAELYEDAQALNKRRMADA